MDYKSIDEDDVENLRLAALLTLKKKSYVSKNTISSKPRIFYQNRYRIDNSFNNYVRSNNRQFTTTNRSSNKYKYINVNFKRPIHTNNNLNAIIPADINNDSLTNDLTTKNSFMNVNSKRLPISSNSELSDGQHLNDKVSTKFSRLERESASEESEDSEVEVIEESDDSDNLSLGEEDKDLDGLGKLIDVIEAEIADGDIKSFNKEEKSLKQKNISNKDFELKVVGELDFKTNESIILNHSNSIKDSISFIEESASTTNLSNIRNSPFKCNLLKSNFSLRSLSPQKRSVSK